LTFRVAIGCFRFSSPFSAKVGGGPPKALEKQLELLPGESEFTPQDDDEFEFNQEPPTQWWNHH